MSPIPSLKDIPATSDLLRAVSNEITSKVAKHINASGKLFLSSDEVKGWTIIRLAGGNIRSSPKFVQEVFDVLVEAVKAVKHLYRPSESLQASICEWFLEGL